MALGSAAFVRRVSTLHCLSLAAGPARACGGYRVDIGQTHRQAMDRVITDEFGVNLRAVVWDPAERVQAIG